MPHQPQSAIIVGGGVIGLCTALECLKNGIHTTILESQSAEGNNCSLGNAGMIVPSHFIPLAAPGILSKGLRWMLDRESPFYVKPRLSLDLARWGWLFCQHATAAHVASSQSLLCELNLESRRIFAEFAKEGDFGLTTRGLLMLCQTQAALDEEAHIATLGRTLGLQTTVLDAAATARLEPNLEMKITGAIHFADDAHLDPARFIQFLRQRILDLGGKFHYDCPIREIETRNGRIHAAIGPGGHYQAEEFVMAGGSWSPSLLRKVGLNIPIQAGKGYSLTLEQPRHLPKLCSILTEAKVAVTPMGRQLRFAGTMEIGGLNFKIDPRRVRGIIKAACRYFPQFQESDFTNIEPWVGLRPVSPDGLPYLGRSPQYPNLTVAAGHAMMGLSLGPITGKWVADLLCDRPKHPGLHALRPNRFQ